MERDQSTDNGLINEGVLQTIIFPGEAVADRLALYARWPRGGVRCADANGQMRLNRGRLLDLGTFYNSITWKKWRALTGLQSLSFCLSGHGKVSVRIFSVLHTALQTQLCSWEGDLGTGTVAISIPEVDQGSEILACEIAALDDHVLLKRATWSTNEPSKRTVRLAAVITTFRREEALKAAVESFTKRTMQALSAERLHLFIVDNGNTVHLSGERITLIKNRNLGGTGGFMRGMLEAVDKGCFTHCLFMDDDASCEPESVWRTMALLAHMSDERTAVSGAMLLEDPPTIQAEKGAVLARDRLMPWYYEALHHYWDLSDLSAVSNNDEADRANYGAWWFFAFPLMAVDRLSFPFFVRGDDVDFSLSNHLKIVTLNGVAASCSSFSAKQAAATEFLASRAWFALTLLHGDLSCVRKCLQNSLLHAFRFGLRFDYPAFEATLDGLEFVMRGPSAFAQDPAPLELLNEIGKKKNVEAATDELLREAQWPRKVTGIKAKMKRVWGFLTLGGHLSLSNPKNTVLYSREEWDVRSTDLLGVDTFVFGRGGKVLCRRRDRARAFKALVRWLPLYFTSHVALEKLQRKYRNEALLLRSREYWEQQF